MAHATWQDAMFSLIQTEPSANNKVSTRTLISRSSSVQPGKRAFVGNAVASSPNADVASPTAINNP